MPKPRDAQLTFRLSADERDALQAAADEADEPISQTARRAIRAFLGLGVAVLAVLLSGCGAAEPTVTDAPVVEASETVEVEDEVEPTDECWSDPSGDPYNPAWRDEFSRISGDPVAAVAMLEALPDPSEGCTKADRKSLAESDLTAAAVRERFPDLFPAS